MLGGEILTPLQTNNKASASSSNGEPETIELRLEGGCRTKNPLGKKPALSGYDSRRTFRFSVAAIRRSLAFQLGTSQNAADQYFVSWINDEEDVVHTDYTSLPFSEQFPDLTEAARGRMNEELTTLATEIHAESNKGDEAFDAFGIKFPSEKVTGWGIIVLIGVQLYFIMYLKRLSSKIKDDDPAWDVPWMAMDQSRLARAMLFVSVLCLPVLAAFLVAVRALAAKPGERLLVIIRSLDPLLIQQNLWMLFGFVMSISLSILSWKYRPKLTESTAPSEVLEDQGSGI